MLELVRNAAEGWSRYTDEGKYAVLLLGILLYLWYVRAACGDHSRKDKKQSMEKLFFSYAALTAAAAVFPPTAAILMLYQTKFYDYEWIWSAVPVTAVMAYGMAMLYLKWYRAGGPKKLFRSLTAAGAGLALLFLCGNLGSPGYDGRTEAAVEEKAALLLDKLAETGDTENICLWAPAEVLSYVRRLDGNITLLYGRNMWEEALNAWSYDAYEPETKALYQWMEQLAAQQPAEAQQSSEAQQVTEAEQSSEVQQPTEAQQPSEVQQPETTGSGGAADYEAMYVEAALGKGVNCILIPEAAEKIFSPVLYETAERMGCSVTQQIAEGYCFYRIGL